MRALHLFSSDGDIWFNTVDDDMEFGQWDYDKDGEPYFYIGKLHTIEEALEISKKFPNINNVFFDDIIISIFENPVWQKNCLGRELEEKQ